MLKWVVSLGLTDLDVKDQENETPLLRALSEARFDSAEWLVNNGADTNCKDRHGNTPLSTVNALGNAAFADFLKKKGATDLGVAAPPSSPLATKLYNASKWLFSGRKSNSLGALFSRFFLRFKTDCQQIGACLRIGGHRLGDLGLKLMVPLARLLTQEVESL